MKKIISTIFISSIIACSPVPDNDFRSTDNGFKPNINLDNFIQGSETNRCNSAELEFSKGFSQLMQSNPDVALLHYQKAHELCPENEIYELGFKQLEKYFNNKIRYKI